MKWVDHFRSFRIVLLSWEYWPWKVIYLPVFIQYLWQSLKFGSLSYPTLLNRPYMQHGGIFEESKWGMYRQTPADLMPKTVLVEADSSIEDLKNLVAENGLYCPLILKVDCGMRGKGITKIDSLEDLHNIKLRTGIRYIVQEFIPLPREIGVFCIKNPYSGEWTITSLMERAFLTVTGNGVQTLEQLISKDDRAFLQLERLRLSGKFNLRAIPAEGEEIILEKLGNHRLGTRFTNARSRLTPELQAAFEKICNRLPGFEYGRLDIRFDSWVSLAELQNFILIEVNGANSEPAHIYQPGSSLLRAWKILFWHWEQLYHLARFASGRGELPLKLKKTYELYLNFDKTMQNLP